MKKHAPSGSSVFVRWAFIVCVAAAMVYGVANAQKKDEPAKAKDAPSDASKTEVRNNAASLLADLLGDEKNVDKILIIKHNSKELGELIKSISKTADNGQKQLEELAKNDKGLNLHALQLPPGEAETRKSIAKTEEHELLLSSGEKFTTDLLLTQWDALNYGAHLAKISGENASSPEQEKVFHSLDEAMTALMKRTVVQIRAVPPVTKKD
jgi:hypothetical protein